MTENECGEKGGLSPQKPGLELDALVAEKVMGWQKIIAWPNLGDGHSHESFTKYTRVDGREVWVDGIPHYSTDISAAWEVVGRLISHNGFWKKSNAWEYFKLTPTSGYGGRGGWFCNFGDSTTGEYGDTAPHAICLAALKAMEQK